jgi:CHAT domain-containing protein
VADASTQDLLSDFHRAARIPGTSRAEALRQAVRVVRADPRYGHLYHWGGFTLDGSWR